MSQCPWARVTLLQLAKVLSVVVDRSRRQRMRSSHLRLPDLTSAEKTLLAHVNTTKIHFDPVGICLEIHHDSSQRSDNHRMWKTLEHIWRTPRSGRWSSASSHQDTGWRQRSCQGSSAPMQDGLSGRRCNTWQSVRYEVS